MKNIKYIILIFISFAMISSCDLFKEDETFVENAKTKNVVTFDRINSNLTGLADGSEYLFEVPIKVVGPTVADLTNDITVTFTAKESSTAVNESMYRIETPTVTLTKSNNYFGVFKITLVTEGNTPPMDGTPEFDAYVAPVLNLSIDASGDENVIGSGKGASMTLNFTPPNPYAGLYDVEMRYFHPTAGGSHPSVTGFDPDDPYGGVRNYQKTLTAVTGRKCETTFAVWDHLCWITCNADNSIAYTVADTWSLAVSLGNPFDATQVSHFDPATRKIYLYYNYSGGSSHPVTGSPHRIFWEVFTPTFPAGK